MNDFGKWEIVEQHEYKSRLPVVKNGDRLGVVKQVPRGDNERKIDQLHNEVKALRGLEHPYIVKLLDYNLEAEYPYMITELCKGGTLKDVDLSEWTIQEKLNCHYQLCKGFAYLWEKGFYKSDHSFKNVFLTKHKQPVIGDFEAAGPITKGAEGIEQILNNMSLMLCQLMIDKEFNVLHYQERKLNKQIAETAKRLEELKQQKQAIFNH